MSFEVGDRVEMIQHIRWKGALATVGRGEVINQAGKTTICVHFDDPEIERQQSYASGWYTTRFAKLDNAASFVPEDWS